MVIVVSSFPSITTVSAVVSVTVKVSAPSNAVSSVMVTFRHCIALLPELVGKVKFIVAMS